MNALPTVSLALLCMVGFGTLAGHCLVSALHDLLAHRTDASTWGVVLFAVLCLVLGAACAIDTLNRLELMP